MNRSSNKEVIFIDKGIENFASLAEKLVKSSDVDYQIVYLDKAENAFAQMADYLSKQNNLDAIHIFSHGAKAAIKLADNYIGEKDLKNHAEALKIIGNSLRQNGDIMLYGCDIAASEEGERFIQTFADLTGADISASQDKTGNSTIYNANWVLESTIGNIESQTLHADEFDGLLYSGTRHYSISLYNQALGGNREAFDYDFSTNDYVFTFGSVEQNQEITLASFLGSSLKLDYGLKVTPLTFGIPIEFTVSEGMFDLYYPVSINVATPSSVVMGDRYVIKTGLDGIYSPQMNIRGPELDIDIKAIFKTSIEAHMGVEWDTFFDRDAVALVGETNDGGESYISKMWGIDEEVSLVTFNREGFSILDKKYTSGLNFENDFISFSTMNNVADAYRLKGQASAYLDENGYLDMRARLVNDEPIMSFSADLDDIVGGMLELFPATKVAGELIRALDGSYTAAEGKSVIGWGDISTNLSYSILSLNATFNLKSVLEVSLDVKDIIVDLISDSGERKYGSIGDEFIFTAPDIEQHWTEIIATYGLKSVLSSRFGFEGSISLDLSMLGLEGKVLGIDVPAFFEKDGTPSNYLIEETWGGEIFSYFPKSLENSYELYQELGRESFLISYGDYTDIPQLNTDSKLSQISVSVIGAEQIETNRYSIEEGNNGIKYVTFRVSRTGDLNKTLSINYLFELGDGIDNKDFENIEQLDSRQIHFNKYEKYKDITIGIKGDILPESDESFVFKLLPTNNINILNIETTVTIYSDDLVQYKMKSEEKSYTGSQRDEEIFGNNENNVIFAGAGNDIIHAGAGNDFIHGGSGNDILYISSNNGSDYFNGGSGTDTLNIDWSQSSGHMYLKNHNTGSSYNYNFDNHSGFESIKSYLESTDELTYQYNSDNYIKFKNVEKLNIRGTKYNDLIIYKGGNEYHGNDGIDTFYADWSKWTANIVWKNGGTTSNNVNISGMERVLLQTGSGKDNIDLSTSKYTNEIHSGAGNDTVKGGSGNDTIYGGDGNDTFSIVGMSGHDYFNGGKGTDAVNLNWSGNQNHRINFRTYKGGYSSSYTTELTAYSAFADIKKTLDELGDEDEVMFYNYNYRSSDNSNSLRLQGVEKINIRGSDKDDLILFWNGSQYHGGGGIDTFYADWSSWKENIVWKNGGTSVAKKVNVSGMERVLLQTGSGKDNIDLSTSKYTNEIHSGAGNDTVKGGSGNDTIYGGDGNDTFSIVGMSGHDYFNGGKGTDAVNLNWSGNQNHRINFRTYKGGYSSSYTTELTAYSAFADIKKTLDELGDEDEVMFYNYNYRSSDNSNSLRLQGVEKINIRGSDKDDLILFWNGSQYHGGGGIDTFYADWSSWKENIVWKNGGTSVAKKVNVSGMERVLLQTGSGKDNIDLSTSKYTNEIHSGAGNDTVKGGSGSDTIYGGDGNDTFSIVGMSGHDYFNGGKGTDAVNLNWSGNQYHRINFRTYKYNTSSGGYSSSYTTELTAYSAFADIKKTLDELGDEDEVMFYNYNYRSSDNSNSLRLQGVEKINIRGSDKDDLILFWNGSQYHGGGGIDTFYADWSSWKENIVWKNGGTSVAKKVNVSGMERVLLQTGSGKDNIDLSTSKYTNEIHSGAGNDTVKGGSGSDTIYGGDGNDTFSIVGMSGHDYFNGGKGTDAVNLNWSGNQYHRINFRTYKYNTSSGGYSSSYTTELTAYSAFADIKKTLDELGDEDEVMFYNYNYRLSDNSNSLRLQGVEKINIRGSDKDDLILFWNGSQYHGGGGIDTFYADWSSWKENIVWKNGGTSVAKKVNVSGMERVLLQTGSGKDNIDLSTSKYTNEIHSGAGNDTVKGGSGSDTIYGGDGNDTFSIVGMSGHDYFNGGKGTDAVNLNWSGNQYHRINFRTYKYNTSSGGYSSSYTTELTAYSAFADIKKTLDELGDEDEVMFYNYNYRSSDNSNSLRLQGVEKINIRGSDKDDLILYWNGSQYHGGEGSDTFYADWSSWTESISWKKGGTIVENKVKVSGMDRLFLNSGTGTDYIDLSDTVLNNEVHANIGHDTVIGGAGNDWLYGDAGRDTLYGGAGNDKLFGGTGNDTLYGDDGNDELYGGAGNDTLTGGKGNDVFVFDTALGKNNIDTIVDFSTSDDKIALSKAIFTGIRYINSSIFTTGKAATDSKQRIIYDDKSGKLYYDEDGSGASKAVHFANLTKELDLDHNHFILA